ncbi:MAG: polysaccharide pyruvyl transferase family protein [Planctomycetota bacterium]
MTHATTDQAIAPPTDQEAAAVPEPGATSPEGMPMSPTRRVRDFFEDWRGAKVHHPPLIDDQGQLVGNNGDRLMVLGTDLLYNDLGIERVDDPKQADLLVLGASGGMLERAKWIPKIFRHLCREFPDIPMCVLPTTFYYPTRPFAEEIGVTSRAPLTIFCREPYSYMHLLNEHELPGFASLDVDHDMAFELASSPLVRNLKRVKTDQVVIVERTDIEHVNVGMDARKMQVRKTVSKKMPPRLKSLLYPAVVAWRSRRKTPFRRQCEQILSKHHRDARKLPRRVADLSNVNVEPFETFCDDIARAEVVFTTRLHVGIFSSLLGRTTYIFGGPYHKIRGIHEFSLSDKNHVTFLSPEQ